MKVSWLYKSNKEKCILFMNGWGCDKHPLEQMKSREYDVLLCYDYREILLPKEIDQLFEDYSEVHLVAWSLGVYVANLVLGRRKSLFTNRIAINGTLSPINNLKGIPLAVFQGTLKGLNEKNLEKFWMRMCGGKSAYNHFKINSPTRLLKDQKEELAELQNIIQNHCVNWNLFDRALVGNKDLIFTAENQKNAWKNSLNVVERNYPHFCFDKWHSWDELIKDLSCGVSKY